MKKNALSTYPEYRASYRPASLRLSESINFGILSLSMRAKNNVYVSLSIQDGSATTQAMKREPSAFSVNGILFSAQEADSHTLVRYFKSSDYGFLTHESLGTILVAITDFSFNINASEMGAMRFSFEATAVTIEHKRRDLFKKILKTTQELVDLTQEAEAQLFDDSFYVSTSDITHQISQEALNQMIDQTIEKLQSSFGLSGNLASCFLILKSIHPDQLIQSPHSVASQIQASFDALFKQENDSYWETIDSFSFQSIAESLSSIASFSVKPKFFYTPKIIGNINLINLIFQSSARLIAIKIFNSVKTLSPLMTHWYLEDFLRWLFKHQTQANPDSFQLLSDLAASLSNNKRALAFISLKQEVLNSTPSLTLCAMLGIAPEQMKLTPYPNPLFVSGTVEYEPQ